MKINTTLVTVTDVAVSREGNTIGQVVNDVIADCIRRDETVTNVSIEVTRDDWIALKLLQEPANEGNALPSVPYKSKLKPAYRPHNPTQSVD